MLNNQVYTQKTQQKSQHKKWKPDESNNQFLSTKEAYNFVLFINAEIMFKMHSSKENKGKVQMYLLHGVDTQLLRCKSRTTDTQFA